MTAPTTQPSPVESLPNLAEITANSIQAAYMEWLAKNSPEIIKENCLKTLDASAELILCQLLGFEKDSWNKQWKLDHCNGRSGESAAGDYIRKQQETVVNAWLAQVKMPTLTASMKKSMESEAKAIFERRFIEQIHRRVETFAQEQANTFFNTIVAAQQEQVANQMKLFHLVAPLPTE